MSLRASLFSLGLAFDETLRAQCYQTTCPGSGSLLRKPVEFDYVGCCSSGLTAVDRELPIRYVSISVMLSLSLCLGTVEVFVRFEIAGYFLP